MDAADIVQLIGKGQYIDKAAYFGVFAEAAFISHLILGDMAEGGLNDLYPPLQRINKRILIHGRQILRRWLPAL